MELFNSRKKWVIKDFPITEIQRISSKTGLSSIGARLLLARNITDETEAVRFLTVSEIGLLYNPFLLNDMDKAVKRIKDAVDAKEKICIYGDYDVDGITATAVLYKYLSEKNANVIYYIPKRLTEGYGMNIAVIDQLKNQEISLIITVDNGITANAETEYARGLGIDVVVTDHHECRGEIPDCCAVVNPQRPDSNYPYGSLAGVGVAFKLICALEAPFEENDFTAFADKYLDLVALGTVADVMPLCDENRAIVSRGISCLSRGSNFGVSAILAEANGLTKKKYTDKAITSSTIGFLVAPRLNAAGRIGDVDKAVEILVSNAFDKCLDIAEELSRRNRERQAIENGILTQALEMVERDADLKNDKIIVLAHEDWHHGVIGIVSSRITEKFGLPSILISVENGIGKGSARSIKGFNINKAIHECSDLLERHGGHELAAGLTVSCDKFDEFKRRITRIANETITDEMLIPTIEADAILTGKDISLPICEEIMRFEPFGTQNPVPVFCMRNAIIRDIISLGQNKHTKLMLENNEFTFEALLFGVCPDNFHALQNQKVDILFNLDINEFRGVRTPQVIIREIGLCEDDRMVAKSAEGLCETVLAGNHPGDVPPINKFRDVYKFLRDNAQIFTENVNLYLISNKMSIAFGYKLYSSELSVIVKILENAGLCEINDFGELVMHIRLLPVSGKVDLEQSYLYKKAKGLI